MPTPVDTFQKGVEGPDVDAWHESAFQVFYDRDAKVEFIELSRGPVVPVVFGLRIFERPAEEVVRALVQHAALDTSYPEPGYSFVVPDIDLALWRQVLPSDGGDGEGVLFDTVAVGIAGYFASEAGL